MIGPPPGELNRRTGPVLLNDPNSPGGGLVPFIRSGSFGALKKRSKDESWISKKTSKNESTVPAAFVLDLPGDPTPGWT